MRFHLTVIAIGVMISLNGQAEQNPEQFVPLVQAKIYQPGMNIADYWQSEKLDGIRAFWDGHELRTRTGKKIAAPPWFTRPLPQLPLDGELWAGRGNFHLVQRTVLDITPSQSAWQGIYFMLFDMPDGINRYPQRYSNLVNLVKRLGVNHIQYVEQTPIESRPALLKTLDSLASKGGEGLMLRRIDRLYQTGRSGALLKLKQHQDAEGLVVGYKMGKGKYGGKMGSLLVRLESGKQFYIGSGFTDQQRDSPPKVGTMVTFRYNGYTQNGIPKFARFMREIP
ncbi:DNA ligase [Vibrio ostreicida]|uniref:DNA ligase n=1 Tax=Vibrio ostreicida TaxID=526588 RepID=A0ABT8BSI7_9VIBR|nr:DNA ligase [Vibrio ostreicida]MDN3609946.1 DNA ligase [Vibrio ostreicida]NPD10374.1 DNA ligase [Vibrio ostreicida]